MNRFVKYCVTAVLIVVGLFIVLHYTDFGGFIRRIHGG